MHLYSSYDAFTNGPSSGQASNNKKSKFDLVIGIGSSTFINRSYYASSFLPNKLDENIKYAALKILYPFRKIKLGIGTRFSSDMLLFNIFISKGFQ